MTILALALALGLAFAVAAEAWVVVACMSIAAVVETCVIFACLTFVSLSLPDTGATDIGRFALFDDITDTGISSSMVALIQT